MSLSLLANFTHTQNLVLPLAQSATKAGLAVRVASAASGVLGTLTVEGQTSAVTWAISEAPNWIQIQPSPDGSVLTITFTNARAQGYPYQFFISASDGLTTAYYPIFLEVKDPLSLAIAATGGTTISAASYDSTVPDQVVEGLGVNSIIDAGVSFLLPAQIPAGLNFVTSDGSKLILRVQEPAPGNVSGGLALYTSSPVTTQFTLGAYKLGTMYDNPSRAFLQPFTLESLSAKAGTPDIALAVQQLVNGNFQLNASVDFLGGQAPATTYEWVVGGTATGAITSGGTAASTNLTWAPSGTGYVTFTFKVKSAATGATLAQVFVNPLLTGTTAGIPCSAAANWNATNAIKLGLSASTVRGNAGATLTATVSVPVTEFNTSETITVHLAPMAASSVETGPAVQLQIVNLTLTAASPSATISFPMPATAGLNQKWTVSATASNATTNPTRTGYAAAVFVSNGLPTLSVATGVGLTLTSNVGQPMTPVSVGATDGGNVITGATFSLLNAPDGLLISGDTIVGNVLAPGTYTFRIIAEAPGYARSYSNVITLTASAYLTPLTISDAVPSQTSLPDGKQFQVNWGVNGTPATLNFIQNFTVRSVLGSTSALTAQTGNSVIAIYGRSYYGDAYTIPALVLSSSILAAGTLLNAPTIGVIDENNALTLQWNPLTVNGNYQVYKGFNIWLTKQPNGTPQLQLINGHLITGLEALGATADSRLFDAQLTAGDYAISMQALSNDATVAQNAAPWDLTHQFPTAISAASISFDHQTVDLNQPVNITLDPNYIGADTWSVIYPDGSTSGSLPMSVKTIAKAFTAPGTNQIIIQTERDYSAANPGVRLRRQVTLSIYVMNQQFVGGNGSSSLTGTLGFGGDAGFEITDASSSTVALTPYAVIMRALVRDTMTNELKLMVASARSQDASSLLGTMAIDVFPMIGRPRSIEPIDPALYLTAEASKNGLPVRIATSLLPTALVGKPYTDFQMQVAAGTGVAPFSWYADALPFGMKLSINGVLSGTPMTIGSYTITMSVMDANSPAFIANTTLTLTVESDLEMTTSTVPVGTVGAEYQAPIATSGGIPPLNYEIVSGQPPIGITIDADTGKLAGVPVTYNSTTDFEKTYNFTVQVTDSIGAQASASLKMTIAPAALGLGSVDQSEIYAGQRFRLVVPVIGGEAPYTLARFTDDGVIGSGLSIANPTEIDVPAGVAPPSLALTVADEAFYPQDLPFDPAIVLSASGGQPPYTYSIPNPRVYAKTALTRATIFGNQLLSTPSASGSYAIEIQVTDQRGHQAQGLVNVDVYQKGWNGYTVKPVQVTTNGSTNPANFVITPLAALPDATLNQPYNAGANVFYGLALYSGNVLHMTQTAGGDSTPMNFTVRSGSLPPGVVTSSANSYGQATDYSGLILFNVAGGQNTSQLGNYSFEAEFSNIRGAQGVILPVVVSRASITVTNAGGGATPVVVVTTTQDLNLDLSRLSGTPYGWYYPLAAEGGTGPYTFAIESGSTLPGAALTNNPNMFYSSTGTEFVNGVPLDATNNSAPVNALSFSSNAVTPGTYVLKVSATDAQGHKSQVASINVFVTQSATQPIHIVGQNLPAYFYAGQALPANTYFVESDLLAAWGVSGLPAGIQITQTAGTRTYLSGTPTTSGPSSVTFTATSTAFNTVASVTVSLPVRARTAAFISEPTSATVGVAYRASNNNAILSVQYTGYQPGDPTLPLVISNLGTVGAPGVSNAGSPTVAISNLSADGFTMAFDYSCPVVGNDVITLQDAGHNVISSFSLPVAYSTLTVAPTTVIATVSEYSTSSLASAPVTIVGGLAPYTLTPSGFSDPRFSALGGQVAFNPTLFTAGQAYNCAVAVTVTDASGQTATAVGTLTVTVRAENYVKANFAPGVLNLPMNLSGTPAGLVKTYSPVVNMVTPVLGHSPFQIYVDSVSFAAPTGTLPGSALANNYAALQTLLQVSASRNLLFVAYGAAAATGGPIYDVQSNLQQGALIGQASALVTTAALPDAGTYTIALALRVVDADGFSTSATVPMTVVITN